MNILELDEFEIVKQYKNDEYYKFVVKAKDEPIFCSLCSAFKDDVENDSNHFKQHDMRTRTVADVEFRGRKVILEIQQRRFHCSFCGKNFTEFFESIAPNDKVTRRLWDRLGKESINESFMQVAVRHGVSNVTAKKAFEQEVKRLDSQRILVAPRVLGIDEIYIQLEKGKRKTPCAIFTDVENKRVIELIIGIEKEQVIRVLKSMRDIENTELATMDMAVSYRNAVKEVMPKAYAIVDRFHVIQKVNMVLDDIRASLQGALDDGQKKELFSIRRTITMNYEDLTPARKYRLGEVLEKYPKLRLAYELKEKLRDVYKCTDKKEAYQKFYEWECSIPDGFKEFKSIQDMINKIKPQVFAYFDGRYTNAFTEAMNGVIRRIIALGNGYSFDTLRARIMYGTSATKTFKTKVKDMNFYEFDWSLYNTANFSLPDDYTQKYKEVEAFGVDIDELINIMDSGNF